MNRSALWIVSIAVSLVFAAGPVSAQTVRDIPVINPGFDANKIYETYTDISQNPAIWNTVISGWEVLYCRQWTGLLAAGHGSFPVNAPADTQVAYTDGGTFRQILPGEKLVPDTTYELTVMVACLGVNWGGYHTMEQHGKTDWWGHSIELWAAVENPETGEYTSYQCLMSKPLEENPGFGMLGEFTLTFDSNSVRADVYGKALEIRLVGSTQYGQMRVAFDDVTLTATTTVPEPVTMGLLALGGLTMLRRRR